MTELTILLVDDHQVFREGVAELLAKERCCGRLIQIDSPAEARRVMAEDLPDVVVTDMSFPEGSGLDLVAWIHATHPDTPALCLSMHADAETLQQAIAAGARGYVTKSSGYAELVSGVERVAAGGHYLDQQMLEVVFSRLKNGGTTHRDGPTVAVPEALCAGLSLREREVFSRLVSDQPIDHIASELCISAKTVENHRSSIYRKLNVRDRHSLYQLARGCGMID